MMYIRLNLLIFFKADKSDADTNNSKKKKKKELNGEQKSYYLWHILSLLCSLTVIQQTGTYQDPRL